MRRVLHGDLVQMGRMLLTCPAAEREAVCHRAMAGAHAADKYRRRFGRRHAAFGDGSLAGWAMRFPRPAEPPLDDPDYAWCLRLVLRSVEDFRTDLAAHRGAKPR